MSRTVKVLLLVSGLGGIPFSQAQISSFQHVIVVVQENRTPLSGFVPPSLRDELILQHKSNRFEV